MLKIQKVSLFFRLLFISLFVILPCLLALYWVNAPQSFFLGPQVLGLEINFMPNIITGFAWYKNISALSAQTKFLGFLISLIPLSIAEVVLYFLIKLFALYQRAEIFTLKNVIYIKKIGYTLLIGQGLNIFYQALITILISWHQHPKIIALEFSGVNISILLVSLLVILISWIMEEGCHLREEQQLTI